MLPGKPTDELQLLSGEDKTVTAAPFGNSYAGYLPLPPGSYNFIVRRTGEAANPLKRLPVTMRGDTYVTFLASEKNGQPNVVLIDDTPNPQAQNGPCHLVLRDFFPKATVTVTAGSLPATAPLAYGDSLTIDNLPIGVVPLNMQAAGQTPVARMWSTEADFKTTRHATLLIVPDAYGRFRPRLAFDGVKSDTSAAPADRRP